MNEQTQEQFMDAPLSFSWRQRLAILFTGRYTLRLGMFLSYDPKPTEVPIAYFEESSRTMEAQN